jgi:hypothetical protein
MSYTHEYVINLGAAYTGKTINAQLYDTDNVNSGAAITAGITEFTGGQGIYTYTATIADSFRGGIKFYENGQTTILAAGAINPETTEGKVSLTATGLDAIAVTDPGAPALHTTIPKMLVALWRTVFKKVTETSTQLKLYADNGTDINATATLSDDGTTKTKGAAS